MIVDDSSTMRRIIRNTLAQAGYSDTAEADNGISALSVLSREKVDFILADWNMPEMDGLQLVKAVRANADLKHIPVLMVTTEAAKDDIIEAIKSGVTGYIVKPFTAQVLKEKVEKVLSK